jgi:hypothetical protein
LLESAPNNDPLSVNAKIRPHKADVARPGRSLENKGDSHIFIGFTYHLNLVSKRVTVLFGAPAFRRKYQGNFR